MDSFRQEAANTHVNFYGSVLGDSNDDEEEEEELDIIAGVRYFK